MTYDNQHKRKSLKSDNKIYADNILPESSDIRELQIAENEIRWGAWMNVLARCPRCEEDGTLGEIEQLNARYIELMTK